MKNICVCHGCGRTIDNEFIFCPWCGTKKSKIDEKEYLKAVFKNLEEKQAENRRLKLQKMEEQLSELENEFSMLALSAEMAK